VDAGGEARIVELPDHPFFLATLFVPQTSSAAGHPHPIVAAFARAAAVRAGVTADTLVS
jgi:CTP synthase (UTP-ammonia lyase)